MSISDVYYSSTLGPQPCQHTHRHVFMLLAHWGGGFGSWCLGNFISWLPLALTGVMCIHFPFVHGLGWASRPLFSLADLRSHLCQTLRFSAVMGSNMVHPWVENLCFVIWFLKKFYFAAFLGCSPKHTYQAERTISYNAAYFKANSFRISLHILQTTLEPNLVKGIY